MNRRRTRQPRGGSLVRAHVHVHEDEHRDIVGENVPLHDPKLVPDGQLARAVPHTETAKFQMARPVTAASGDR